MGGRVAATPRYQQIAEDLRRRIESHEFTPTSPLPTEGQLQEQYEASRNTVREAVRLLVAQGRLETRLGQGTFVTPEITPFVTRLSTDPRTVPGSPSAEGTAFPVLVRDQGRVARMNPLEVSVRYCPASIASRLQIAERDRVISRYQDVFIDDRIWSSQTTYYPLTWVEQGAEELMMPEGIEDGTLEYLARTIGLKQVGYRDQLFARLANDREQRLFRLSHNHTVIEVYRTSFTEDQTPIRVTVTVLPADRNQIVYDLGEVPDRFADPV
jgi:GntR family transcriptional regulator